MIFVESVRKRLKAPESARRYHAAWHRIRHISGIYYCPAGTQNRTRGSIDKNILGMAILKLIH
jgi:hypothetical protein